MKKFILFSFLVTVCLVVANAQNYRMTVTMKDGSATHFQADNVQSVTFDTNGTPTPVDVEYIEVAGIKWAKGNLTYANKTWSIADNQLTTTQYVGGNEDQTLDADYKNSEYFSWGVTGKDAVTGTWCNKPGVDLTKFYSDDNASIETADYNEAVCGDLAKWATMGSYRMPTRKEFNQLLEQASQQYGYVVTPNGNKVYGLLFTDPKGEVEQLLEEREIEMSELETGLFLVSSGQGWYESIIHAGRSGYYWSSTPIEGETNGRDAFLMEISSDGAICYSSLRSLRCCLRPVVNDNSENPQEEYTDMTVAGFNALDTDKNNVKLILDEAPGLILFVNNQDVYLRCDNKAIRLTATGLEKIVSVGDVCMGSVKGNFRIEGGMPVIVGNVDSESSLADFMHLPGGADVEACDVSLQDLVNHEHRCDLIKLMDINLFQNEFGLIYAQSGDDMVMIADGFGINPFPESLESGPRYVIEGIFAEASYGNPVVVFPVKAIFSPHPDSHSEASTAR